MNLQPLGDRLIVEALEDEETTASGIVLPDTAKEKPQRGRVLAVGPGARNDKGELVPLDVAVGDEIIFSKYGGTEIKLGTDDVLVLREVVELCIEIRDLDLQHRVVEVCLRAQLVEEGEPPRQRRGPVRRLVEKGVDLGGHDRHVILER